MTPTRDTAILALVILSGLLVAAGTTASTNGTVGIALSDDSEPPGEYANLLLTAEATNVTAYEANLTFDPSVLQVRVISGDQFPPPETTVDNEAGWVQLNQSRNSALDFPVVAGLLVYVRESATPGTRASIEFVRSDTSITNATDGELSIVRFKNATISVAEPPDTTQSPAPDTTASTTTTTRTESEPAETTTDGSTTTVSTTFTEVSTTAVPSTTTARPVDGTTETTHSPTTTADRPTQSPSPVSTTSTPESPVDLTVGSTTSEPTTQTTTRTASDAGPGFGVLTVLTAAGLLVVTGRRLSK